MVDNKSASKKRKRDDIDNDNGGSQIQIRLAPAVSHNPGPLLVVYPAVQPPSKTSFKAYSCKNKKPRQDDENESEEILIAGETDEVEFVTNDDETRRAAESGCRYIIAIHNRRTRSLNLLPTSLTPHILKRTVKALKSKLAQPPSDASQTTNQYQAARTALGETFGTKKAKAALRAQERNRVDVGAMTGVMDYVMEGIQRNAGGLMTAQEAKETADTNRLIPPYSADATDPDDIYPLSGIIPDVEWKALSSSVDAFDSTGSERERLGLLPYQRSQWINAHMRIWGRPTPERAKERKKNLKLILYISSLFAFRSTLDKRNFTTEEIRDKLSKTNIPSIVVDGLFSRFTEKARGSTSYQATSNTKTLLLAHLFVLCLKLDNFATNTESLSHDLSISKDQINQLFRSLGCQITALSERERSRLGISEAATTKYAVLNAPVVFPKPRQKRRN